MKIDPKKNYSVITGDIIGSSKLSKANRKGMHKSIKMAYSRLQKTFSNSLPFSIDVFRGDSWQFLIVKPQESLRIALCFRLLVKAGIYLNNADVRISLATGKVDFLSKDRISESDGEAFRISGQNLEKMRTNLNTIVHLPRPGMMEPVKVITTLLDSIFMKFTGKQSLVVFGALTGLSQSEIALLRKPAVSQQMVSRHLKSAGWYAIKDAVEFYEHNT